MKLSVIADRLVADGYVVIEQAFEHDFCEALLQRANEREFCEAGISASEKQHIDKQKRRDKIAWLDESHPTESHYLQKMRQIQNYLNKELYLGLKYYESHFAIYEAGDFYEKHRDAFRGSKNRVVSSIMYLNENWIPKDEGELIIYDNEDNFLKKIAPKNATLVLFLSDKFPHEVLKSNAKRYSIAGWFRVDKIGSLA